MAGRKNGKSKGMKEEKKKTEKKEKRKKENRRVRKGGRQKERKKGRNYYKWLNGWQKTKRNTRELRRNMLESKK